MRTNKKSTIQRIKKSATSNQKIKYFEKKKGYFLLKKIKTWIMKRKKSSNTKKEIPQAWQRNLQILRAFSINLNLSEGNK